MLHLYDGRTGFRNMVEFDNFSVNVQFREFGRREIEFDETSPLPPSVEIQNNERIHG